MIGSLRGVIAAKQPPVLLLEVQGVGYEVEAPMSTFYQLPEVGASVVLYTHLVVREDAHLLFGFATTAERTLFRSLIRVNGVGPRLALTILSGIDSQGFARCVQDNDTASLTRLPGVGKKTAERLVIEMRDRLPEWQPGARVDALGHSASLGPPETPSVEAVSALLALGYKPQEASRMVHGVVADGLSTEEIIRAALQGTVKSGQRSGAPAKGGGSAG